MTYSLRTLIVGVTIIVTLAMLSKVYLDWRYRFKVDVKVVAISETDRLGVIISDISSVNGQYRIDVNENKPALLCVEFNNKYSNNNGQMGYSQSGILFSIRMSSNKRLILEEGVGDYDAVYNDSTLQKRSIKTVLKEVGSEANLLDLLLTTSLFDHSENLLDKQAVNIRFLAKNSHIK